MKQSGFSLLELMAVVVIILVMLAMTALTFANSRPSIKVKRDAAHMVSFLRTMWDLSKSSGSPLVLEPDFEKGSLAYINPRDGKRTEAKLAKEVVVIGIKLNDRLYSRASIEQGETDQTTGVEGIHIGEGRGLSVVSVLFGVAGEEAEELKDYKFLTQCSLNLITGKGEVRELSPEDLDAIFEQAAETPVEGT